MQIVFTLEWFEIQILFAQSRGIVISQELESLRNEL